MLIDRILGFCDAQYCAAQTDKRCDDCNHQDGCSGGCKDCLKEIHYPSLYPNGKKLYDCPNLINFYVCDYTYKYATEIYYLMQNSTALTQIQNYRIFSIGCGACPDLMAFEAYLRKNKQQKTIEYRGIDKNPLWEPIHSKVREYSVKEITYVNLATEDVFTFLEQFCVGEINVLVLQYIISALYVSMGVSAIDKLFDLIVDSIVRYKRDSEPFVILINDVNSRNMGRELFLDLKNKLKDAGFHGDYARYYFDNNIKVEAQRYGTKHENSRAMPPKLAEKYRKYEPWQFCTSAQLLIEIGGNEV